MNCSIKKILFTLFSVLVISQASMYGMLRHPSVVSTVLNGQARNYSSGATFFGGGIFKKFTTWMWERKQQTQQVKRVTECNVNDEKFKKYLSLALECNALSRGEKMLTVDEVFVRYIKGNPLMETCGIKHNFQDPRGRMLFLALSLRDDQKKS